MIDTDPLVSARHTFNEEVIYRARHSIAIADSETLPESIQLFPPGSHHIWATKNGEPSELKVTVTAQTAERLAKDFQELLAAAEAGQGPRPFIDFNHDDREASGWVTSVFWAGDHPKEGGIRAKIEWSEPGARAIKGKAYRQFSPNFRVSSDTGEIVGTTANMGGLVNRPAFRGIQPFFAADGGNDKKPTQMNKLFAELVSAGLLSAIPTDEAAATIDFSKRWDGIKAKLSAGDAATKMVGEQTEAISALTKERNDYKAKADAAAEVNAKNIVTGWVRDGIILAKDEEGKAAWTKRLIADPESAKLMEPLIKAKQANKGSDLTTRVIKNNADNETETNDTAGEHLFLAKAREIEARDKIKHEQAIVVAARENPKMYEAYRKGLLYTEVN